MDTACQEKAIIGVKELLDVERAEIAKLRALKKSGLPANAPILGLALSGGGIRSATINLGILQALAKYNLLKRIDYLSTVSGGGYIGGWLARWIYERGIDDVQKRLGEPLKDHTEELHRRETPEEIPAEVEPAPVTFLRDYSNYLTPRTGLLGADAWAAVTTYLRNVLLNQVILVAFLGAILFLPWILGNTFESGSPFELKPRLIEACAAILVMVAVAAGVVHTSTCAGTDADSAGAKQRKEKGTWGWTSQRCVLVLVVLPLFAGAYCLNYTMFRDIRDWRFHVCVWTGLAVYTTGHLVGWLVSKVKFGWNWKGVPAFWNVLWAVPSGVLAGIGVHALKHLVELWLADPVAGKWQAVTWGPPLFVLVFLLVGTLHIGLAKFALRIESYEWWARLGGWLMLWGIFWAAMFGLAIFVPLLVFKVGAWASWPAVWAKRAVIVGWLVHSGLGAKLGWSTSTSGSPLSQSTKEWIAKLAPFVFVGGLLILLATGAHALALAMNQLPLDGVDNWWAEASAVPMLFFVKLAVGLGLLTAFLSWRVDINRFSMNILYRNRLVRCYLGASNEHRSAQRFTGFDPADDLKLACLAEASACDPDELLRRPQSYDGPYPILNATLNVTHGQRLGWQERKAESFIFTPKYCGFDYPEMNEPGNQKLSEQKGACDGGYHRTQEWAMRENGVSLGTAIAVSGAAVSPNMGFHTFPPLAFLMTVFNVRLGEWLANPRFTNDKFLETVSRAMTRWEKRKSAAAKARIERERRKVASPEGGPRSSLLYLLFELFGTTTDVSKYVYLSDGAHFENLALYELVRRECDFIIASDAGEDPNYVFEDLANAIRRCRTDLGAEIVLDLAPITANAQTREAKSHAVRGDIFYLSGRVGKILYFKSCITGGEPNDVQDYLRLHKKFPQQSTADQWFDESQFESYRQLGFFAANSILKRAKKPAPSIEAVFANAPTKDDSEGLEKTC